jgi:hypothetical protein
MVAEQLDHHVGTQHLCGGGVFPVFLVGVHGGVFPMCLDDGVGAQLEVAKVMALEAKKQRRRVLSPQPVSSASSHGRPRRPPAFFLPKVAAVLQILRETGTNAGEFT